jgi:hypothetical protein
MRYQITILLPAFFRREAAIKKIFLNLYTPAGLSFLSKHPVQGSGHFCKDMIIHICKFRPVQHADQTALLNHFFAFGLRWGQPGQQHGLRFPSWNSAHNRTMCSFLVPHVDVVTISLRSEKKKRIDTKTKLRMRLSTVHHFSCSLQIDLNQIVQWFNEKTKSNKRFCSAFA